MQKRTLIFLALRGLEGAIVTKRRCRRHYGSVFALPFKAGVEPKDARVYYDPMDGIHYRNGWMSWPINKVGGPMIQLIVAEKVFPAETELSHRRV